MAETQKTGWASVNGFLDGLGGATDRIGGIVNTVADGAEDVARGRAALHEERQAQRQSELDMTLQLAGFERGDNLKLYWVVGAVAAAVIILTMR